MPRAAAFTVLIVLGCSSTNDPATSPPCTSDDQCKGTRLCIAGTCVDREGGTGATGGAGAGGTNAGGSAGRAGSGGAGTSSGGAGGASSGCTSVLDCNVGFRGLVASLPDCKPCLLSNCGKTISDCGAQNENCPASLSCFVDPYLADYGPSGSCLSQSPKTPLWCYVSTDACVTVRAGEPAGFAFTQCMAQNCETECGLEGTCTTFPACSSIAP
ncbi:MAG TPA: hypothetical protein VHE30_30235 [Polyangiaceae bacterium]|nr:hypothetical protein [Polyangiaceae bacterium]